MSHNLITLILVKLKNGEISRQDAYDLIEAHQDNPHRETPPSNRDEIAVIGIGCRFPGAANKEEYWDILKEGRDMVRPFPATRRVFTDQYLQSATPGNASNQEPYMYGGYFDQIDTFDNEIFGIPPTEAARIDPHQRIFLETALETFEDAGYGKRNLTGSSTGVYVGNSAGGYRMFQPGVALEDPNVSVSFIPQRVSNILELTGPTMMVSVGCSSSLLAVHLACQGILAGDCSTALAGGVALDFFPVNHLSHIWNKLGIYQDKIRCRAFDDRAAGIAKGEGCGLVLLKSLSNALKDGDYIYAVIKGSTANQDGHSNGITAPNPEAQADMLKRAWEKAGINPRTLSYIEAHGTGTRIGDPIEFKGLTLAFDAYTKDRHFCALGSCKTNLGHLADGAAGIAGFIKTVLALQYKQIPPSLHFEKPNRLINFEDAPIYINNRLIPWESESAVRRAGVSAFGLVGTNIHVVLEEFPEEARAQRRNKKETDSPNILCLSARGSIPLEGLLQRYKTFLDNDSIYSLDDICYTANTGREHGDLRIAILCSSHEDLTEKIAMIVGKGLENCREIYEVYYTGKSAAKIRPYRGKLSRQLPQLKKIAHAFIDGTTINWETLYCDRPYYRVPLPYYCFEKKQFWVKKEQGTTG